MKVPTPHRKPALSTSPRPAHAMPRRSARGLSSWPAHAGPYLPAHAKHKAAPPVFRRPALAIAISVATLAGMVGAPAVSASAATTTNTLNLKVLVVGGVGGAANDPTTAAWDAALTQEGVPYTEVDASGTSGAETVSLPALSSGATGNYNGVIIAGSPANFSAAALAPLSRTNRSSG